MTKHKKAYGSLKTKPVLKLVIFFVLGLALGLSEIDTAPIWFLYATAVLLTILIITFVFNSHLIESCVSLLLIFTLGLLFGVYNRNTYNSHPLVLNPGEEVEIKYCARLLEDGYGNEGRSQLAMVENFIMDGRIFNERGKVWLRLEGGKGLKSGERIWGSGILKSIPFPRNPGDYDIRNYCRRENIKGMIVSKAGKWEANGLQEKSINSMFIIPLRRHLISRIEEYFPSEQAEILKGLILGIRRGLPEEFKDRLRLSGLWHLLSLSGLHLGIIAGIVYFAVSIMNIPFRIRPLLIILALGLYCILVETRAPVIRAFIIIALLFGGRLLHRYPDRWNLLALSALIILIFKPWELFSPGFHLTYAAAGSILAVHQNWGESITRRFRYLLKSALFRYPFALFIASLAASLGTFPFLAYHFGGLPFVSIPASLIGIPLTGFILVLFPLFYLFTFISGTIAGIFSNALWAALEGLGILIEFSGKESFYIYTPDFNIWCLLITAIPVFLLILRRRQWLWVSFLAANAFIWRDALQDREMRVTFLDIGQGNCALIETPGGENILVDAGPRNNKYDSGEKTIAPFLKRKGIRKIDYLIITHDDRDHIGGLESIVKRFEVVNIILGPSYPPFSEQSQVLHFNRGSWLKAGGALLIFLHPVKQEGEDNELSIVFNLIYQGHSVLFPGDIPAKTELELIAAGDLLDCDLLLVSHHGSKYSSHEAFLAKVSPRWAVISAGRNNPYGHPAPETMVRLQAAGIEAYNIKETGAAVFKINSKGIRNVDWK